MAEFQVVYPDSTSVYSLTATPTTKSSLNSAGLSVEDASYKSTLANDNLVIESVGAGAVAHTLGWNASGFTMDSQLEIDYSVGGSDFTTKLSGANGLVVKNETDENFVIYNSNGVSAYNIGSTRSNLMTYADNTISNGSDVATLATTGLTVAGAASTSTVVNATSVAIDNATSNALFHIDELSLFETTAGGGLQARVLLDRIEIADTDPLAVKVATLDPVKLRFFRNGSNQDLEIDASGTKLTTSAGFQPTSLLDVSGNAGVDGQYLLSNGTNPVWTTVSAPAVPNLAAVLAVAAAGDAEDQPISNLSSLGFQESSVGQAVLAITAVPSAKPAATFDVMNLPYAADATTGRVFSNQYVEISVAGTSYWVQLFSAPPAP